MSKFQVGLKSLLLQGLSAPVLMKIVGSNNFTAQIIKIISHYEKIGYNINVLQQTACLPLRKKMHCREQFSRTASEYSAIVW